MNNLKRQEPLLVARAARAALLVPSSVPSSAPCQDVGRDFSIDLPVRPTRPARQRWSALGGVPPPALSVGPATVSFADNFIHD